MALIEDIVAIEALVKAKFPDATTTKQTVPTAPVHNSFVIRFLNDDRETETRYHYRIDRDYQIVYFATKPEQVLPKMDALARAFYEADTIGRMRVESFAFSQPAKTEGGIYVSIGILETAVRESRTQPQYPKMNKITVNQR
ncbi:hypothetical protein [Paenibacillus vini]|uniref:DUF3168 domain-containing protein n=1 Tax=Paenibacillus vini TaxID=1476024 RepID=A0ABQ4MGZ4_9BACL|nr:hypothetical protein [Paenibacillus vini]GIP55249.1 hypothetical protein J42TS3_42840 [Paenibacillus vini]